MDGERYRSVMWEGGGVVGTGCGGDMGGGVCCLLAVPEGCSCQVNVLQCTLEGVDVVVGKHIKWNSIPLCYCSEKEAVFVVVVGGGYVSVFAWVVGFVWLCLDRTKQNSMSLMSIGHSYGGRILSPSSRKLHMNTTGGKHDAYSHPNE